MPQSWIDPCRHPTRTRALTPGHGLAVTLTVALVLSWAEPLVSGDDRTVLPQYLPISAQAEIGGTRILLEVARTPEQRARGLMRRPALPAHQGMLFPSPDARPLRMWMKNTLVPLDIVFIYRERIVALVERAPPCAKKPCPVYGPGDQAIDHVLELRAGRIAELGVRLGDPILLRDHPPVPTTRIGPIRTP
ncbi:hypothetical protein CKO25_16895 [Thiocapsa imhoffii]|uniref:DUF192 domain-containing protein n=1 Tax=Thiocapsa imhoffii TaxID=382777 RepID=A0A9X1BAH5_9GAMM|nr:DUF192 domain-containing protein [Thiocapsa imhoffii]MBK1646293.1 hypothetical protein [Thiocapsa imhoffii]